MENWTALTLCSWACDWTWSTGGREIDILGRLYQAMYGPVVLWAAMGGKKRVWTLAASWVSWFHWKIIACHLVTITNSSDWFVQHRHRLTCYTSKTVLFLRRPRPEHHQRPCNQWISSWSFRTRFVWLCLVIGTCDKRNCFTHWLK